MTSWLVFLCCFDIRQEEDDKRLEMARFGVQDKAYKITKLGGSSRVSTRRDKDSLDSYENNFMDRQPEMISV